MGRANGKNFLVTYLKLNQECYKHKQHWKIYLSKKQIMILEHIPFIKSCSICAKLSKIGIADPLYRNYQGVAGAKINYAARELINYSSYNYLGLNGDPRTIQAVTEVLAEEGTTVSASRIVAGQRVIHQKLEDKLAELYQTEDAIVL